MKFFTTIANRLIAISERRPPDEIIGDPANPYLRRWWIVRNPRFFNIYLHHFLRSDDDRALHDHPWWNCSILLRGAYLEIMENHTHAIRQTGSIVIRRATHRHRIHLLNIAERPHTNAENLSWDMTVPQWADWFHSKHEPLPC